jgi:putative transcriptional regulator
MVVSQTCAEKDVSCYRSSADQPTHAFSRRPDADALEGLDRGFPAARPDARALNLLALHRVNYNRLRRDRGRTIVRPRNPMADPLAHVKQPLSPARRGKAKVEFEPVDVGLIRAKFGASQREFARLVGISVETLRNWEQGRRRPHGPARALLRAIDADPFVLARVLNWHVRDQREEPDDWPDE